MAKTLFLGVEGSGKTTLAMALARAFARHRAAGWYLRPVDRGAYNFATIAPEDFTRDGFPRQTANVREMTWRIEHDGEDKGALEILDYPGEVYRLAFLAADDEPDPVAFRERAAAHAQEIKTLRTALAESARVFVLFNLQDALDLRVNDANRSAVWVTNESLKAVKALPSKPQVTLVFTQVDRYQTADDFLHTFRPTDLDLIGHDHPDVDWTMVSVLMPADGEFGVDAFVRRCTGLSEFGVPTGRPFDVAAANAGSSLARLAAAQAERTAVPVEPPTTETASSEAASVEEPVECPVKDSSKDTTDDRMVPPLPPTKRSRGMVWILCAVLGFLVAAVLFFEFRREGVVAKSPQSVPSGDSSVAKIQSTASTNVPPVVKAPHTGTTGVPPVARAPQTAPTGDPPVAKSQHTTPTNVPPIDVQVEDGHPSPQSQAVAKRIGSAAWSAWVKDEAKRLERAETAQKRLAEALKAASPQEAHDALCDAAEAGNAEAQYRLACVYDYWGWGAWVRTKEDRAKGWTAWLRRIDFEKGAKAVPVSRTPPNAEEYRKLALDWYRSAAAQGVAAAVTALKRHGESK